MSRRERSIARASPWSFLATFFLLPAVAQAAVTATGILDFSWTTTGVSSVSDPNVGGYGIFQFDDADPWNLQVRERYDPAWQLWGGAAKSFGTTSLASSIASQISDNSTTPYPLAADGQMSATATAIKPDDQTYERAVSSVQLGFVRVLPDLSSGAHDTAQAATLGLTFGASSSLTPNSLVTDASAFSNMFFSVAMRVGLLDDEGNTWQAYSFYSENPSDPGSYGATWDINPHSVNMFFSEHPIGASMQSAATGEYITVPEFDWADYQAVLEKSDLIDDYTGFEMSFSVTGYASEYGRTAESLPIDKYWIGNSGSWDMGDKWNRAGEPATGDAIHLETDDDATRVVTYDTTLANPTFISLRIDATNGGSITLQQPQDSLRVDSGYTEIGWAGQGTFEQDGGTSTFDTVIVGSKADSDGSVILSGGTTTINRLVVAEQAGSVGSIHVHNGGDLTVATDAVIGEGGSGTFVQDGGTSAITTTMIVGAKSGSTGSVSLSGGTTTVNRLVVAENTGSTGSVAVSGTGALTVKTDAVIGQRGNGSFSLGGGSLTVEGWGTIGVSNNGSFTQTDGTSTFSRVVLGLTSTGIGTFDLSGGMSTIGELVLGHDAGSQGTFNLSGTGDLVVTGDATIGSGSVGVFNHSGGTANVGSYLFVGRAPSGEGTVNLSGGQLSANQLTVGHDPGATGDVNLSGDGRLLVDGLTLGLAGSGDLLQTGGELAVKDNLHLGQVANGKGDYRLQDGVSSIGGDVYVGVAKDSIGWFTVAGGSAIVGGNIAVALADGSKGSLVIDGGSLSVTGAVGIGAQGLGVAAQTAGDLIVGTNLTLGVQTSTGVGSYTISGGAISVGEQLQIGSIGVGTFDQSGSSVVAAKTVLIGGTNASGNYVLQSGTLNAGLNINVGAGEIGTGTLEQRAGSVTAGGYLNLGVSDGGHGYYVLKGGNLTVGSSGSAIGVDGYGQFSHGDGTHTTTGNLILGSAASGEGWYLIGNGGVLSSVGQFIGDYGTGRFVQSGGSNSASGDLFLGSNPSGVGSYQLRDGTLSVAGNEFVGHLGTGQMTQSGGSHMVGGTLRVGGQSGGIGTYDLSNGMLRARDVEIGMGGTGSFIQTGGTHQALSSLTVGDGVANGSHGSYELKGGTLNATALVNKGSFTYSGGSLNTTVLFNDASGIFAATGAGERVVNGIVVNTGTFKVTDTTVKFDGLFINAGAYVSDPSNNYFTDLQIDPAGYLQGEAGDAFFVSGDFENRSAQTDLWNTIAARLTFTGVGPHDLYLPSADLGDSSPSFAWGTLELLTGVTLNLFDGNSTPGAALYVGTLLGAIVDDAGLLTNIVNWTGSEGLRIYYDIALAANDYLNDFDEVGYLALPTATNVPEPSSLALFGLGLAGLGALRRKKRVA